MAGYIANIRRVVVGLKGHEPHDKPRIADFFTCLVDHFSPNELSTTVNFKIEDDLMVLFSPINEDGLKNIKNVQIEGLFAEYGPVTLYHSVECPFWKLSGHSASSPTLPQENRGTSIGAAILLESSDSHLLMTQRSDKMRTHPRAWVPPGGTLEVGEYPLQCALREMEEEVGLVLNPSNSNIHLLCLWESAYPLFLSLGKPSSHFLVLYFHVKSNESWEELQKKIKLDGVEVKACTWLTREHVKSICAGPTEIPVMIKQFIIGKNGGMQSAELNIHSMFLNGLWQGKDYYTGSQIALLKWVEALNENLPSKI